MLLSTVQEKLIHWSRDCSYAIGDHFDATIATLDTNDTPAPEYELSLRQLIIGCQLSSESALLLVANGKLWDAEAIERSVVEGTFKVAYLCVGNNEQIKVRFKEFTEDLPEINRIKRHQRLAEFLANAPNPQSKQWRPFRDLILPEEEYQTLIDRYPRSVRKSVENHWSFHSITNSLSNSESELRWLGQFKHLFFQYGMASHILHQDADGIAMLLERMERSDERRDAIELAHGARIVGDLSVMAFIRHLVVLHLCGKDTKPAMEDYMKQEHAHNERTKANAYWHDLEYREQ